MALLIGERPFLLADTGPFCRFAEGTHGQLRTMADYLGENLWITQDVAIELNRRSKEPQHRALAGLSWEPKFPVHEPLTITDARLLQTIEDIVNGRRKRRPGHFMEDRGEVATVLLAKQRDWPALIDDRWGTALAAKKGVETCTTEDLCLEMAVTGHLSESDAFEVFERVFWSAKADFDARLATLRAQAAP